LLKLIVVGADELGGVEGPALERRVDLARRQEHHGGPGLRIDFAPQARNADLQPLQVIDAVDLLPEPSRHLGIGGLAGARDHAEGSVGLFPELEPAPIVVPGVVPLGVQTEGYGREPLEAGLLAGPVIRRAVEGLHRALHAGVEDAGGRHQLAAGEDLDLEAAARQLVDDLREPLRASQQDVVGRRPHRGQPPLHPGLGDYVGSVDDRGRAGGHEHAARLYQEFSSLHG
jgi:hypothetical protein